MVVVAIGVAPEGRALTIAASRLRSPIAIPNPVPNAMARRQKGRVPEIAGSVAAATEASGASVLISDRTSAPHRIQPVYSTCCRENRFSRARPRYGANRTISHWVGGDARWRAV